MFRQSGRHELLGFTLKFVGIGVLNLKSRFIDRDTAVLAGTGAGADIGGLLRQGFSGFS